MSEHWTDFVRENDERITQLNNKLVALEQDPDDEETMREVFRIAHTLKGNSAAAGLEEVSDVAHAIEDLLDAARAGRIDVTPELMDTVFDTVDELESMVEEVEASGRIETDPEPSIRNVAAFLESETRSGADSVETPSSAELDAVLSSIDPPAIDTHDVYLVRVAVLEDDPDGITNGRRVLDALIDAFDVLGTDPGRAVIEDGTYGGRFDAIFTSAVTEEAIAAALDPIDVIADFEIVDVTDRLGAASHDSADAEAEISTEEASELEVDELLDQFDEFDDLDEKVKEVEDDDDLDVFDEMGDAGSFDDLFDSADVEPEVEADSEDVDEPDEEHVDDAEAVFAELKEEVEPVGFEELTEELEQLEFDEFGEEEIGMDELIGDELDSSDDSTEVRDEVVVDSVSEGEKSADDEDMPEAEQTEAPADDDGLATADDDGLATADDDGLATADDDGLATADDDGLAPADDDGLAPADDGVSTADDDGLAVTDDDGLATADDEPAIGADTDEQPPQEVGATELEAAEEITQPEAGDTPTDDHSSSPEAGVESEDRQPLEGISASAPTPTQTEDDGSPSTEAPDEDTKTDSTGIPETDPTPTDAVEASADSPSAGEVTEPVADSAGGDVKPSEAVDESDDELEQPADTVPDDPAVHADSGIEDVSAGDDSFGDASFDDESYVDDSFGEASFDDESYADDSFGDASFDDGSYVDDSFGETSFDDGSMAEMSSTESEPADTFETTADASSDSAGQPDGASATAFPDEPDIETSFDEETLTESGEEWSDQHISDGDDAMDLGFGEEESADEESVVIEEPTLPLPDITIPKRDAQGSDEKDDGEIQSIRVDVEQVDQLLNLVEGLVTTRVRLRHAVESGADHDQIEPEVDDLEDLVAGLQETVTDVRLVPLETVVNRLPRIVRDVTREQDKQVDFEIQGSDVELDRTILERLRDPLVHLVRNAVDHGIESPDERLAADKPETGSVEVSATRNRDQVTITVTDDGSGLDPDRLRSEAIEAGVIDEDTAETISDEDAYDLAFHPGLSTAEEVTDISGRGVGMDVVERTIESLDGTISISSDPGNGTTVTMTLPVSIAIDDILFVECGGEEFGVPTDAVYDIGPVEHVETIDGEPVLPVDEDDHYPVLDLEDALETPPATAGELGMVVRIRDDVRPVALQCDHVHGQQEVVVKPFDGFMSDIPGLGGATIRGQGKVVTILDVTTL